MRKLVLAALVAAALSIPAFAVQAAPTASGQAVAATQVKHRVAKTHHVKRSHTSKRSHTRTHHSSKKAHTKARAPASSGK